MIKYATAIRVGTASTEAILRRFTRNASHPVYQAMLELGRAQKTKLNMTRRLALSASQTPDAGDQDQDQ
jgi:TnpA family transposase